MICCYNKCRRRRRAPPLLALLLRTALASSASLSAAGRPRPMGCPSRRSSTAICRPLSAKRRGRIRPPTSPSSSSAIDHVTAAPRCSAQRAATSGTLCFRRRASASTAVALRSGGWCSRPMRDQWPPRMSCAMYSVPRRKSWSATLRSGKKGSMQRAAASTGAALCLLRKRLKLSSPSREPRWRTTFLLHIDSSALQLGYISGLVALSLSSAFSDSSTMST
mmetsp:Transcript_21959/g.55280  ORF Transcript_21959/g.55280 Transcript_21959/m.55280 type:complete len:221 (-) Transcript_21959:619-1281(-)